MRQRVNGLARSVIDLCESRTMSEDVASCEAGGGALKSITAFLFHFPFFR